MMKFCPLINKYNCYEMNFPSEKDKWVKFEKMLHGKEKRICPAYISKYNSTRERKIIPLMTPNKKIDIILQ